METKMTVVYEALLIITPQFMSINLLHLTYDNNIKNQTFVLRLASSTSL